MVNIYMDDDYGAEHTNLRILVRLYAEQRLARFSDGLHPEDRPTIPNLVSDILGNHPEFKDLSRTKLSAVVSTIINRQGAGDLVTCSMGVLPLGLAAHSKGHHDLSGRRKLETMVAKMMKSKEAKEARVAVKNLEKNKFGLPAVVPNNVVRNFDGLDIASYSLRYRILSLFPH